MKQSIGASNLIFPCPVMVAGTYDENGEPNVATLAWGGVASSDPESISIAVRPSRYTYEALKRTGVFTVNLPSVEHAAEVDFFGIASGRKVRKFEVTGLTPVKGEFVDAPYIAEFPLSMECQITNMVDLEAHTLFIGKVLDSKVDASLLDEDGNPDFAKGRVLTFDSGLKEYRAPGESVGKAFSIGKKYIAQ